MYHARPYDRTLYTVPVLRATIHHIRCTYEIYVLRNSFFYLSPLLNREHVCTTVLSKKKILLFYLSSLLNREDSLLNREERDYSPLVTGAVSAYTVCTTVLSKIKILFFLSFPSIK
jgi:hypothetical protein